jgi:two-component system, OmpR family, osmolarity sensor histidine kinase EnvZ
VRSKLSLFHQSALRLIAVFVVFEVLIAAAVLGLLMLPLARQAAGDLASLMMISAQTWSELPPETRPVFAHELETAHQLILTPQAPADAQASTWHGPYAHELEARLSQRVGSKISLANSRRNGEIWHWVELPSGGGSVWLGFAHNRIGTRPLTAIAITLGAGLLLAVLGALWLARRTVAPLDRFAAAAASLGRGETPGLLPETGPRELAALAARFNDLAQQVRELLDARTTLLAGLSHDLRTPLARMRLALEMLQRKPEPKWAERLEADMEEMNQLVGDMLELARGLGQEATDDVDVAALLADLAARATDAGASISCRAESLTVRAPVKALRRVLANLVDNAVRHGGGTAVELGAKHIGDELCIEVLDGGPGIPADQLDAVFRPFHRVDVSRNPTTGGTGLGLAIVRQLALANGWRVILENRAQGGLAARLFLTIL